MVKGITIFVLCFVGYVFMIGVTSERIWTDMGCYSPRPPDFSMEYRCSTVRPAAVFWPFYGIWSLGVDFARAL